MPGGKLYRKGDIDLSQSRHLKQKQYKRIAIFRALKLGDLLCSVPAMRALRYAFPDAEITLIGLSWARAFVDRYTHLLDNFFEFPGHPAFPERDFNASAVPAFFEDVISRRFDLAVQLHGSGSIINTLMVMMGAQETAGFYLPGGYCPEPERYAIYPSHEPEIWRHLSLMAYLGIPLQGDHLEFPIYAEDRIEFQNIIHANGIIPSRYICIHPGASNCEKCWPVERFAAAADQFIQRGFQVVLTGSKAETGLTASVIAAMNHPAIDLAGKTDLGVLGALIDDAHLLLSNDTGVAHIAAALQTPSVILFTNSEHKRWSPLNKVLHRTIPHANAATAEDVVAETEPLLEKGEIYAA
jgi:ADP-heptose:LPS heptosyltransferase